MNFIEIQSWPEIPSIGFFVSLFSSSFKLPDFDIEVCLSVKLKVKNFLILFFSCERCSFNRI